MVIMISYSQMHPHWEHMVMDNTQYKSRLAHHSDLSIWDGWTEQNFLESSAFKASAGSNIFRVLSHWRLH